MTPLPRTLSPREQQVLEGVWKGVTNRVMAQTFGLSVRTVEIHRHRLMQKMRAHNAAQLIRTGLQWGLIW
jgi:two-component system, LuxR family, response regulator FixJ